jgi:outer membrane protein assembly factor BamB
VDIDSQPIIQGDYVYVVSYQGYLTVLSLKTGDISWRRRLSSFSGLAVDQDRVYVTDSRGKVWAFDKYTGSKRWVQNQLQGRELTRPVVTGQMLAFGDRDGYVHWLNRDNGALLGRYKAGGSGIVADPLSVRQDLVIYTQNGDLYRLRTNKT